MTDCKWDEKKWKEEVASHANLNNEKDTTQNIAGLRLPEGFTAIDNRGYNLRAEAIESVFVMYRLTGEQSWQAAAWDMWTAIMRATDTDLGNSALMDVSAESPPRADSMEVSLPKAYAIVLASKFRVLGDFQDVSHVFQPLYFCSALSYRR
jgi:mannosyl-oligosaccharide alpha-1,2-mannosidase